MSTPRMRRSGSITLVDTKRQHEEPTKLPVNYPKNMRYGRRQSMPATMIARSNSGSTFMPFRQTWYVLSNWLLVQCTRTL